MGNRLRHNYSAIFGFLLLTWMTKLLLHPSPPPLGSTLAMMVQRAAVGPIPGPVIIAGVAVVYLSLLGLMLFTPRLHGAGTEILPRSLLLRRLVNPEGTPGWLQADPVRRIRP